MGKISRQNKEKERKKERRERPGEPVNF